MEDTWQTYIEVLGSAYESCRHDDCQPALLNALHAYQQATHAEECALLYLGVGQRPTRCISPAGKKAPLCLVLSKHRARWQGRLNAPMQKLLLEDQVIWLLPLPPQAPRALLVLGHADIPRNADIAAPITGDSTHPTWSTYAALLLPLIEAASNRLGWGGETPPPRNKDKRQRLALQAVQELSNITDVQEMLTHVAEKAMVLLRADGTEILTGGLLPVEGRFPPGEEGGQPLSRQAPFLRQVYELATRLLGRDPTTYLHISPQLSTPPPLLSAIHKAGMGAALIYPIQMRSQLSGFLALYRLQPTPFSLQEIEMGQILANYLGPALYSALLYRQEREQRDMANALALAAGVLAQSLDQDQVLDEILEQLKRVIPHDTSNIMLVEDEEARVVRWRGYERFHTEEWVTARTFPTEAHSIRQMLENRAPIVVRDTRASPDWIKFEELQWLRSYAAAPIVIGEEVIGFISVDSHEPDFFSAKSAQQLQAFADYAAIAIQNARLYRQAQEQTQERERLIRQVRDQLQIVQHLYELSAAFLSQMSTSEVLFLLTRSMTDHTSQSLGAAFYQLATGDDASGPGWQRIQSYVRATSPVLPPVWQGREVSGAEARLLESCWRTAQPLIVSSVEEPEHPLWQGLQIPAAQVLYYPMRMPERGLLGIAGVLVAGTQPLSAYEMALIRSLLQQGSAALVRAALYEESHTSEGRMRAILESSRDGIILVDTANVIRYLNRQALRLLAMSAPASPLAMPWEGETLDKFLAAAEVKAPGLSAWLHACERGEGQEHEFFETPQHLFLEQQHWDVYSESGPSQPEREPLGSLYLLRDITERRQLEQMRDDLLNMLVHDMRNPIATIQNAIHLLNDPLMADMSDELLEIAHSNTERVLVLVNTILDIGRMEEGRFELHQQAVMPQTLLTQAVQTLALSQEGLSLTLDVPDSFPPLWVDPAIIRRVVENIMGNALKFVSEEGAVRVSLRPLEDDASMAWVEIFNNGPPIPPQVLENLFEKFRAGNYKGRGYGLGLAFCRLAVEAHGGRIWAENHSEGGVSFYFTLPLYTSQDIAT